MQKVYLNLYEKSRQQRHTRLLIMISILAIILTSIIMAICIRVYIRDTRNERLQYAKGTISVLKKGLSGDLIKKYRDTKTPDDSYYVIRSILQDFADSMDYIQFLYIYSFEPDMVTVIFDCDTKEVPSDFLGDRAQLAPEFLPYQDNFLQGKQIPSAETKGEYGWLITYGEPIFDTDGNCVAYIFIDLAMEDIYAFTYRFIARVFAASLLVMIICISVGSHVSIKYHQKDDIEIIEKQHKQDSLVIRELTEAIAKIIDTKDTYTTGHSSRVAMYTAKLAKRLGYDEDTVETYYRAALLHDIGKMAVPKKVLNKEGRLTDEEFAIIKSHAIKGYNILKHITVLPELALGAGYHHERPDGKGYPEEFAKQEIPYVAQIIAVADTFDAMYSDRPYRKRMKLEKIFTIMNEVKGKQLNPEIVDAMIDMINSGEINIVYDDENASEENIDNIMIE